MELELALAEYTDFIPAKNKIHYWFFKSEELQTKYKTGIYSEPVQKTLYHCLTELTKSKDKTLKECKLTIWWGDSGSSFEYFNLAISDKTPAKVKKLLHERLSQLNGYLDVADEDTEALPLVPMFRYESGILIEYVSDEYSITKKKVDVVDEFGYGLRIKYRMYQPAEQFGMKEKYCQ